TTGGQRISHAAHDAREGFGAVMKSHVPIFNDPIRKMREVLRHTEIIVEPIDEHQMDRPGPLDLEGALQDRLDDLYQPRLDEISPKGLVRRLTHLHATGTIDGSDFSAVWIDREDAGASTERLDRRTE